MSENCFKCHGPDEGSRKAGLRLDVKEGALAVKEGKAAIVPGQADASELVRRIESADPDAKMPPAKSGKELKPEQIALLKEWVAQGANWPVHWSFAAPERPAVPAVKDADWVRNPIDNFVLARLEKEGLKPSPPADATTLLRRMSLDITGLPPTLEEADYFTSQDLESAYAHAAERLLASPHFGERWARHWLDVAQFADSDGFEKDKPRQVWAWRDWVINAFNNNLPYDEFIRKQVAGDMLPGATQDDIVATGFLRNNMNNEEGGIDPEQFRMEGMFSRMDVIGRAVLGLTLQCAQCHSHKYDPISQTDYYRLFAYINNSAEACMQIYTPQELAKKNEVLARVAKIEGDIKAAHPGWQAELAAWEAREKLAPKPDWKTLDLTFDATSDGGQKFLPQGDGSYLAAGYAPTRFGPKSSAPSPLTMITAVRVELLTDPNLPRNGPGRSIYGSCALSEFNFRIAPEDATFDKFEEWEKVEVASAIADVNPPVKPLGNEYPDKEGKRKATTGGIDLAIDKDGETAWTTDLGDERTNQPRYAIFKLAKAQEVKPGMKLGVRLYQGHGGWNSDDNQNNNLGRFRVSVTDALNLPEHALPVAVLAALDKPADQRTAAENDALFGYWRSTVAALSAENAEVEKAWADCPRGDTQLVYHERDTPRETFRLNRGDFLQRAEKVEPGVPGFLHPMRADAPKNRIGLAEWLTDKKSPTTARTFVNQVWQHYFGVGLVSTPADLGSQGDPPSNQALLDWLACEFMDSGWDVKALHKLIVSSATYRQSSAVTPELLERDPDNRLIARGARFREDGEIVRDIALAASGLLNPEVGGPSRHPLAPAFLFEPPASYGPKPWKVEDDGNQYRRGIYTFRYRSVPYPMLQTFDTPPGDSPCPRRVRSNSPLQALTTLNEPVFQECAQALAKRTLSEGGKDDASRLNFAFRRCNVRAPEGGELDTLQQFLDKQRKRIAEGTLKAEEVLGKEGAAGDDDKELAAWTLAARVLFNLDETITRE